jgi:hypothetical protein
LHLQLVRWRLLQFGFRISVCFRFASAAGFWRLLLIWLSAIGWLWHLLHQLCFLHLQPGFGFCF